MELALLLACLLFAAQHAAAARLVHRRGLRDRYRHDDRGRRRDRAERVLGAPGWLRVALCGGAVPAVIGYAGPGPWSPATARGWTGICGYAGGGAALTARAMERRARAANQNEVTT